MENSVTPNGNLEEDFLGIVYNQFTIFSKKPPEDDTNAVPRCHFAASSIFSIKIPYPRVGSLTSTWVTAPTSLPSWMMGLPDMSDCH